MKTTEQRQLRVGILADDLVQLHHLRSTLSNFGFDVVFSMPPQQQSYGSLTDHPEAWVVDVHGEDAEALAWLDILLSRSEPVLLGVDKAPSRHTPSYPKWEKKLYTKMRTLNIELPSISADTDNLEDLAKQPKPVVIPSNPPEFTDSCSQLVAQCVWVLGASMGGPNAVKEFFDALPSGLPVAFIYAQHIDPAFESSLGHTIGRHSEYHFKNFTEGELLYCGDVLIAPIENEFVFNEQQQLHSKQQIWPGPYGPSIDQVILNVNNAFGSRAGYIIFSGMGNDGADAIANLDNDNLEIWAQTPNSCASSSMPESAIATGKVKHQGTPIELADRLVRYIKQQWETTNAKHNS